MSAALSLKVNLRQLEKKAIELQGELPAEALDIAGIDELIQVPLPLEYDLTVELLNGAVLAQGYLRLPLKCECGRCLKPFETSIELEDWAACLELEGEEKVEVKDDCVDLTPIIREDILLVFPQLPLCEAGCRGLIKTPPEGVKKPSGSIQSVETSSAWAELNKLKFRKD